MVKASKDRVKVMTSRFSNRDLGKRILMSKFMNGLKVIFDYLTSSMSQFEVVLVLN
jgi:hypothetical protein